MKHLLLWFGFLAILFSCEKNDFRTLEAYEFETVTWKLSSIRTWNDTSPPETQHVDSDRTLKFWNGRVRSNGSFCDLDGVVGPIEEMPYNATYQEITNNLCTDNDEISYWIYEIDAGELRIIFSELLVGTIYVYEAIQE